MRLPFWWASGQWLVKGKSDLWDRFFDRIAQQKSPLHKAAGFFYSVTYKLRWRGLPCRNVSSECTR